MSNDGFFDNVSWEGALVGGVVGYLLADTSRGSSGEEIRDAYEIQALRRGIAAETAATEHQITPDLAATINEAKLIAEQRKRRERDAEFAKKTEDYLSKSQWIKRILLVAVSALITFYPMFVASYFLVPNSLYTVLRESEWAETLFVLSPQLLYLLLAVIGHLECAQALGDSDRKTMHRHGKNAWHSHDGGDRLHRHPSELADPPHFMDQSPDSGIQPSAHRADSSELPNQPDVMTPENAGGAVSGWYPDPAGRFESRYWDGLSWTRHVFTGEKYRSDDRFDP